MRFFEDCLKIESISVENLQPILVTEGCENVHKLFTENIGWNVAKTKATQVSPGGIRYSDFFLITVIVDLLLLLMFVNY